MNKGSLEWTEFSTGNKKLLSGKLTVYNGHLYLFVGESFSIITANRLSGLYRYDQGIFLLT